MYIIYNQDGSVRYKNLADYIQKGNNDVNSIFIAIKDLPNYQWTATVVFTLPTEETVAIAPTSSNKNIDGITYNGWNISLSSAVTLYEGLVYFSIQALNLSNQILFTYRDKLVINPSIIVPDTTTITYAQYLAILQYIESQFSFLDNKIGTPIYRHRVILDAYPTYTKFSVSASDGETTVTSGELEVGSKDLVIYSLKKSSFTSLFTNMSQDLRVNANFGTSTYYDVKFDGSSVIALVRNVNQGALVSYDTYIFDLTNYGIVSDTVTLMESEV